MLTRAGLAGCTLSGYIYYILHSQKVNGRYMAAILHVNWDVVAECRVLAVHNALGKC